MTETTSVFAVKTDFRHREKLINALPTFMNQCAGGVCGSDKPPDSFEIAALAAMQSIAEIGTAQRHSSHVRAVLSEIRSEIDRQLRLQP